MKRPEFSINAVQNSCLALGQPRNLRHAWVEVRAWMAYCEALAEPRREMSRGDSYAAARTNDAHVDNSRLTHIVRQRPDRSDGALRSAENPPARPEPSSSSPWANDR